jgi:hypothetical protein
MRVLRLSRHRVSLTPFRLKQIPRKRCIAGLAIGFVVPTFAPQLTSWSDEVVKLPLIAINCVLRKLDGTEEPRRHRRSGRCNPPVVVDRAIGEHLEILRRSRRRRIGIRFVPCISHANAFDRFLRNAVNHYTRMEGVGLFSPERDVVIYSFWRSRND